MDSHQPTAHRNKLHNPTHCTPQNTAQPNTLHTPTHCTPQPTAHPNTLHTPQHTAHNPTHCTPQHTAHPNTHSCSTAHLDPPDVLRNSISYHFVLSLTNRYEATQRTAVNSSPFPKLRQSDKSEVTITLKVTMFHESILPQNLSQVQDPPTYQICSL